ncbi:hypothetical protein [Bowmanella denitrificans]|uniref:hypothetical protein n=1 Tax=Bowmanella denitrificans TaxID=366582 RepID=UPI000C9A6C1D|nr:hypothetical protein [Bowmanella denitrificans]
MDIFAPYSVWLYHVGNVTWLGYFLAYYLADRGWYPDRSFKIAALTLVLANFVMQGMEPVLMALSAEHGELIRHTWYPAFAAINCWSAHYIVSKHRQRRIPMSPYALSMVFSLFVLTLVQAVRYFDRLVLDTNSLDLMYKLLINTVNIGIMLVLLAPVLKSKFGQRRPVN